MDARGRLQLLTILTLASLPGSVTAADKVFGTDFEAAQAEAVRSGRPLLVHFYADYCAPCRRMEAEVLHDPELVRTLGALVVAVKVNTARRPDLAQRFGVDRIPHDRVLAPTGRELARSGGFLDKWNYMSFVRRVEGRFRATQPKREKPERAEPPEDNSGRVPQPPAAEIDPQADENLASTNSADDEVDAGDDATAPAASDERIAGDERTAGDQRMAGDEPESASEGEVPPPPEETPLLGLEGYCPVALNLDREWKKGSEERTVEYKGYIFRLSSAENEKRFRKNPERFAPQVLGCDPVILASSHRAVAGLTDYGAFFDGKLYLFQSQENRTAFKKNPLTYVRIRHALDISKIERTAVR